MKYIRRKTIKEATKERTEERNRIMNMIVPKWYQDFKNNLIPFKMKVKIRFQFGNKKLASGNGIAFIIFSLPAVITCPYATAHCMHECYARRDERWTSVRTSRAINYELSKRDDFGEMLYKALCDTIYTKKGDIRKKFRNKEIIVRVHESGDFYNVSYMLKWFEVAKRFYIERPTLNIKFFAYTKSLAMYERLYNEKKTVPNFLVRASIWDDTTEEELAIIERCNMPTYTAYEQEELVKAIANGVHECTCESCTKCGCMCARYDFDSVATGIH